MRNQKLLAVGGCIMLFCGVFTPIVSLPMGTINYFRNGSGDGIFILILAALSLFFIFKENYQKLWFTGLASFGMMAFTFINFQLKVLEMKSQMQASLADNPFRGIASVMMESVSLQWGWCLLFAGAGLLIYSAHLKSTSERAVLVQMDLFEKIE